jgi:hypothetical protein
MSDSKPCPVEAETPKRALWGHLLDLCATCPNRAPSAVERELRDCLQDVLSAVLIGPELRNRASALLARKGSESWA